MIGITRSVFFHQYFIYFQFLSEETNPVFKCNFDSGAQFTQVFDGSTGTSLPSLGGPTFVELAVIQFQIILIHHGL